MLSTPAPRASRIHVRAEMAAIRCRSVRSAGVTSCVPGSSWPGLTGRVEDRVALAEVDALHVVAVDSGRFARSAPRRA